MYESTCIPYASGEQARELIPKSGALCGVTWGSWSSSPREGVIMVWIRIRRCRAMGRVVMVLYMVLRGEGKRGWWHLGVKRSTMLASSLSQHCGALLCFVL